MPINASTELPERKPGQFFAWLEGNTGERLLLVGLAAYLAVVVIVSLAEWMLAGACYPVVVDGQPTPAAVTAFRDLLYFNFVTILTIGYGDLHPTGIGRLLSVFEALVGVGLFSALVAVVTVKALLPPANAVVFSKYAYYCTRPQRLLIIFVNPTKIRFGNVQISSYFKLEGDWGVKPSVTAPFITNSVQTFYVECDPLKEVVGRLRDGDCLRVGLVGGLGFTSYSVSIQYNTDQIIVIDDRQPLVEFFEPRWDPDFTDIEVQKKFHYRPEGAPTLREYVAAARKASKGLGQNEPG